MILNGIGRCANKHVYVPCEIVKVKRMRKIGKNSLLPNGEEIFQPAVKNEIYNNIIRVPEMSSFLK